MARKTSNRSKSKDKPRASARKKAAPRAKKQPHGIIRTLRDKIIAYSEGQSISNRKLLEFMSEFLAVEKGGIQLYTAAAKRSTDPEIKGVYENFLSQTENHARILTEAIEELGGDPSYMSPGAVAQEKLAKAMLSLEVPKELRELKDAELLLLAETKDHMDWEFLDKISSKVEQSTRELLRGIVSQVEDEEDEHLEFAKKAVEKLALRVATSASKSAQSAQSIRRAA
jgi:rubrerythrin